jgi:hypothetical protein
MCDKSKNSSSKIKEGDMPKKGYKPNSDITLAVKAGRIPEKSALTPINPPKKK